MSACWWDYVQRVSAVAANKDIAERTGLDASAVSRWKKHTDQQPTAQSVVAFARGYNRPAIEALIAAGYLTDADLVIMGSVPLVRSISEVPDSEFIAEMQRRLSGQRPVEQLPNPTTDAIADIFRRDLHADGADDDGKQSG